jgi:tRNA A37 threonylcarbamoyladenosine synthetase subunit TsaC/SUA5/YrdC
MIPPSTIIAPCAKLKMPLARCTAFRLIATSANTAPRPSPRTMMTAYSSIQVLRTVNGCGMLRPAFIGDTRRLQASRP